MVNKHQDHDASCLCCYHLTVIDAYPAYSEYTPGSEMEISCDIGLWEFKPNYAERTFREMHHKGLHCPYFAPKD